VTFPEKKMTLRSTLNPHGYPKNGTKRITAITKSTYPDVDTTTLSVRFLREREEAEAVDLESLCPV